MCDVCDAEHGRVPITDAMRLVAALVADLYELPGCATGGPLHIVTDDLNVEDVHLDYCRIHLAAGDEYSTPERDALALAILDGLTPMSEDERCWALRL